MSEPPKGKQAEQGDDTKERPAKGPQRAISLDQFPLESSSSFCSASICLTTPSTAEGDDAS